MRAVVIALGLSIMGGHLSGAEAQSMSAKDILAKVDERLSGQNEYQALLNDPDPARSLAAMEIMLQSGDPILERMALEFGLYSPNAQVQMAAVKGYLDTGPVLSIYIDASAAEDKKYFQTSMRNIAGSINEQSVGYASMQVGDYDEEKACYKQGRGSNCFVRLSETEVSISPWSREWYSVKLNDKAELVGAAPFAPSSQFTIPITK